MTDAARMHDVTPETRRIVDLVLDYSRERLLAQDTPLDKPLPAAELSRLAGRTISEEGVGAERALCASAARSRHSPPNDRCRRAPPH